MIPIIQLAVFGFLGLSVIYILVSVYSRSVRRERLEKQYDAGGIDEDRSSFIQRGMVEYQQGLRRRLIWLVYIIPIVLIAAIVYVVNYR